MTLNRVIVDHASRKTLHPQNCACHNGCDLLELSEGADWHWSQDRSDDGYVSVWYPEFQGWSVHYFEESK